jgi:8-oxo-dGTP pyrophosphatase MutT (NUDIX family)
VLGSGSVGLRDALTRLPVEPPALESAGAAVLAVLRPADGDVEVLLIQRSDREGDPASGQVSLPGGHREPVDRSLAETAMRELAEEVGLTAEEVEQPIRYFGTRPAPYFRLEVAAFVTVLGPSGAVPRAVDPTEVEEVFWLPRSELARVEAVPRTTHLGERAVEAAVFDGHVVWGFTRRLLMGLFERLEAAPRPGDALV